MIAADTASFESDTDRKEGETGWPENDPDAAAYEPSLSASEKAGREADDRTHQVTAESTSGTGWPGVDDESPRSNGAGDLLVQPSLDDEQSAPPAANRPSPVDDESLRVAAYRRLWGPPGRRSLASRALGRPYVWDGGQSDLEEYQAAADDDLGEPEPAGAIRPGRAAHRHRADPLTGPAPTTERAVIGEHLRELAAWCQIGACIARYTDSEALGEADIRNRAVAAGWCVDLFDRMICPSCNQRDPVWSSRPPLGLDRIDGLPQMTAETHMGRHRRMRWPTPKGADSAP